MELKIRSIPTGNSAIPSARIGPMTPRANAWSRVVLKEMELASLAASGTPHTLKEKAYYNSDSCTLYFCKSCGQRAEFNKDTNHAVYNCSKCKDKRNIVALDSTWSLNLFIASLNSMGIDLSMGFQDPCIEEHA
jgi:DNA-directed RNA polymerase beta subunit